MTPKEYIIHPTLCSLPWIGVYVGPNGVVKNCAITSQSLGNLHQQSIEQCVNSDTNVQIKTDMLDKIAHPRCSACYKVETLSTNIMQSQSNRHWYRKYGIADLNLYTRPDNFNLQVLDLRWKNTCNLACVYCGPDLSSKWAQELKNYSHTVDEDILNHNKQYVFQRLKNINHVYLAGGEPLLIKENLELLDRLSGENPNVEIRINTNLMVTNNEIFKRLITFKNVKWTVSVDSIEDQFEYIRYPASWKVFLENLTWIKEQNFDINFNMVWNVLNSTSIFDCIDYLTTVGFHENTFIVQCLDGPAQLDVRNLSQDKISVLKEIILNKLASADPKYWLHKSLDSMYNFICQSFESNIDSTFEFLFTLDQRRHLDSRQVFKELYSQ